METCIPPYLSPQHIFQRIKVAHFTGRDWLTEALDSFLAAHDRGYFILEAEAGLGKTAYMAHLVKQRQYLHLFMEQSRGLDNISNGLRSLAAQLIRAWDLQAWFAEDILPGMTIRPNFIYRLLTLAARQRDQQDPDRPIVLLIDGLDAAGTLPGQNVMSLPDDLPRGVYILVTRRPTSFHLTSHTPIYRTAIAPDDPRNHADMQQYLHQAITWEPVAQALQAYDIAPQDFIATLIEKSHGIWSYLFHVLHHIQHAIQPPLDLDNLPDGTWAYYTLYWHHQRAANKPRWERTIRPLIATLSALFEDVGARTLRILSGIELSPKEIDHLLQTQWNTFVAHTAGPEPRYSLSDNSLRDFFNGCTSCEGLDQQDRTLLSEITATVRGSHNRIARYYLEGWGGLEHQLPKLPNPSMKNIVIPHVPLDKLIDTAFLGIPPLLQSYQQKLDGVIENNYGLRHLIAHLYHAHRTIDIHRILELERTSPQPQPDPSPDLFQWINNLLQQWFQDTPTYHTLVWYKAREQQGEIDDYLADISQAWQLAQQAARPDPSPAATYHYTPDTPQNIGLQCRYALITSSINSLAHTIPIPLLVALLEKRIWLPNQILVYIREIPDDEQSAVALSAIVPYLKNDRDQSHTLLSNTLALASALHHDHARASALAGIAPHLPPDLLAHALATTRTITDPEAHTHALAGILPYLPQTEHQTTLTATLQAIPTYRHTHQRVVAIETLAAHLPADLLPQVLSIAQDIQDNTWRTRAIIALTPYLSPETRNQVIALWETWDTRSQSLLMATIPALLLEHVTPETVMQRVQHMHDYQQRMAALVALAPHLPQSWRTEAATLAHAIEDPYQRIETLTALAPHLPPNLHYDIYETIRALPPAEQIAPLLHMLQHAPNDEQPAHIRQILDTANAIQSQPHKTESLTAIATTIAKLGYLNEAFDIVPTIPIRHAQTRTLIHLAPYLPHHILHHLITDIETIRNAHQRSNSLAILAPHLPENLLPQALDAARIIGDCNQQAQTLIALVPHLPEKTIRYILDTIQGMGSEKYRAETLPQLAPYLPHNLLATAFAIAQSIQRSDYQRQALTGILPYLPPNHIQKTLHIIQNIADEHERAAALQESIPYLPPTMLHETFRTIQTIANEPDRTAVLIALIPHLPPARLSNVLAETYTIKQPANLNALLQALTPRMAREGNWRQAYDQTWNITNTEQRTTTLVTLAPQLPPILNREILAAVRTIRQPDTRAYAMATLYPHAPPEEQPHLLNETLYAALSAHWQNAANPATIAPHLIHQPGIAQAIRESVETIEDPHERAMALLSLAPCLPDETARHAALQAALTAAANAWDYHHATIVAHMVAHFADELSPHLITQAYQQTRTIERETWQLIALLSLIPHLAPPQQQEAIPHALAIIERLWEVEERLTKRAALLPYLSAEEQIASLTEAITYTRTIDDTERRTSLLQTLAPHLAALPEATRHALWNETLSLLATRTRSDVLADLRALVPLIAALDSDLATPAPIFQEVANAILQTARWFP